MEYKYPSHKDLKNYSFVTEEELLHLMDSTSLFGRKFLVECKNSLFKTQYIDFITHK